MPYNKFEGDKTGHVFICEVCEQLEERGAAQTPKDWVVIWGATGEGTNQGTECYCPEHAQEGRARKDAR